MALLFEAQEKFFEPAVIHKKYCSPSHIHSSMYDLLVNTRCYRVNLLTLMVNQNY